MKSTNNNPSTNSWLITRNVLSEAGIEGVLTLVGPGEESKEQPALQSVVVYVSEGSVTVAVGLGNFILRKDEVLHIAAGKTWRVRNPNTWPAKILAITLPTVRRDNPATVVSFP